MALDLNIRFQREQNKKHHSKTHHGLQSHPYESRRTDGNMCRNKCRFCELVSFVDLEGGKRTPLQQLLANSCQGCAISGFRREVHENCALLCTAYCPDVWQSWMIPRGSLSKMLKRHRWCRGSVLASGTQVRGFKPGRSRRIFKGR